MANTGSAAYSNVTCVLATTSSWVTLLGWAAAFDDCLPGTTNHNGRFSLMLEVATNALTGVQFPFDLFLRDAAGNTAELGFYLSCVPQLTYLAVAPRTNAPGGTVSFTAYFHHYGNVPDGNGLATVRVTVQGQDASQPVPVDLAPVAGSTGVFAGAWTIPSVTDWQTSVQVFDIFGKTGNYEQIFGGGFSSRPYDARCDVLLYSDYQVHQTYSPPITHAFLMDAVSNAGCAGYWWDGYYRGMISEAELTHRPILFYFPSGGGSDLPYDTQDRRALIRHLDNGGQAALLGATIAYSIYNSGDTTSRSLLANSFGAAWVTNFGGSAGQKGFTNVLGAAGDPVGSGLALPADIYSQGEDEILAVGNGTACFGYDTNSAVLDVRPAALGTAGVRTSNTVFLAFFSCRMYYEPCLLNDLARNLLSYFSRSAPYVHGGPPAGESTVMVASRTLTFHWGGFNLRRLEHYEVAIGSSSNATDLLPWTAVSAASNLFTWSGRLPRGQPVYALVRSVAATGVLDGPVCSAGLSAGLALHAVGGDFDADRKCDPALYRPAGSVSGAALSGAQYALALLSGFGGSDWLALPGDFDGDGKADPAIYNPGSGDWQVACSAGGYARQGLTSFGGAGFIPLAGDYDGDRKSDPAVYQLAGGAWTVKLSASAYAPAMIAGFGGTAYLPVAGDFDGDRKADPALYRPEIGQWLFRLSGFNYAPAAVAGFGGPGYLPLVADYDADGKTDLALYAPASGDWCARLSSLDYALAGLAGCSVADGEAFGGDFDGDGKADLAIYSPSLGLWGVQLSASHYGLALLAFGAADAAPVQ